MRVAVTGASGFTGRFVVDELTRRGAKSVPLEADLCDAEGLDRAVRELEFDCLVHLAAQAFVDTSDWAGFYRVNQIGTFNLLDAIARAKPGTRCVVASSAQIYGPGAEGLIAEDAPSNPGNHYALSKWAMERGTGMWRDRLEIVITRPFNYTGVGQSVDYLVPKIVDHFRRKAASIQLGNLWVKRDFGDVRSVAEVYAGLALADAPPPLVNICSGHVSSIDDIVATLTALSGHDVHVETNPAFVRKNDVETLGGDDSILRAALPGWQSRKLRDTLQWMYAAA